MQIGWLISVMTLLFSVGMLQNNSSQIARVRTPFEGWCGGDDDLTRRVCHAVDEALDASPDFVASDGKRWGTLLVTITENVRWKEIGNRTQVFYSVEFTSVDDKKLGSKKGSCWNDDFRICGAQILKWSRSVVRKIDPKH